MFHAGVSDEAPLDFTATPVSAAEVQCLRSAGCGYRRAGRTTQDGTAEAG